MTAVNTILSHNNYVLIGKLNTAPRQAHGFFTQHTLSHADNADAHYCKSHTIYEHGIDMQPKCEF